MNLLIASPLEKLPVLVLERVCEYLDDESVTRRSLRAFALTSRYLHAAAEAQCFSQIELWIRDPNELEGILRRCSKMLAGGRHRHVRRLKISWAVAAEERKRSPPRQDEDLDEDGYQISGWNLRPYFHMHEFCRPSKQSMDGNGGHSLTWHPENWVPLGQFVSQFPGLQHFIWAAGGQIPPSVFSAVSEKGCRLHHHSFGLRSLIHHRDNPQPMSAADYSLCTSPSLFSIVVRVASFESGGLLNYIGEALLPIVSELAPNLTHMCVVSKGVAGEIEITRAIMLGKPDWRGFLPGKTETKAKPEADRLYMRRRPQTLVFPSFVPSGIDHWARLTDFTNLRCLVIKWRGNGVALAEIASRGDLKSLEKLELLPSYDLAENETEQSQNALHLFLSSLNPLQRLELGGYISPKTFDIIVHRHGESLRTLSMNPARDIGNDSRKPLVVFSAPVLQQFAEHCPQLTHLSIPINRTRGDKHEVDIYRALSKIPRLQHLSLQLMYSVGPDEEFWDEDKDGQYPLSREFTEDRPENIPFADLREAFSNGAVDEGLAREIFDIVSGGRSGTLRYLSLEPMRKVGFNAPDRFGSGQFRSILRWFNRSWVCKHDVGEQVGVMVKERDRQGTESAEEEWSYLFSDDDDFFGTGEQIFVEVLKDLWLQKTDEWWKDWSSLPLDLGEDTEVDGGL